MKSNRLYANAHFLPFQILPLPASLCCRRSQVLNITTSIYKVIFQISFLVQKLFPLPLLCNAIQERSGLNALVINDVATKLRAAERLAVAAARSAVAAARLAVAAERLLLNDS